MAKLAAILTIAISLVSCTRTTAKPELRLFTWSEYFDQEIIDAFESECGCRVKLDYFSNNEEMLAKVQISVRTGGAGYDLIMPSDYMVSLLIQIGLLQTLDHSKLSFLREFDPRALRFSYDPGLTHSVPLTVGTTGIAVNTRLAPKLNPEKVSWRDLFESKDLPTTVLDDSKEVLNAVLIAHGKSMGNASEKDIRDAFSYLKLHKANIRAFTSETRSVVESEECALCQVYSGDAMKVTAKMPWIRFINPLAGGTQWADNFCIPKNATRSDLAYAFMNFMLRKDRAKDFTERLFYRTPSLAAKAMLSPDVQKNTGIFPTPAQEERVAFMPERKDLMLLIDKLWTEFKLE